MFPEDLELGSLIITTLIAISKARYEHKNVKPKLPVVPLLGADPVTMESPTQLVSNSFVITTEHVCNYRSRVACRCLMLRPSFAIGNCDRYGGRVTESRWAKKHLRRGVGTWVSGARRQSNGKIKALSTRKLLLKIRKFSTISPGAGSSLYFLRH